MSSIGRAGLESVFRWMETDLQEVEEIRPNIFVQPNSSIAERVKKDIKCIEENPIGRKLLEKISECKTKILINPANEHDATGAYNTTERIHYGVINYAPKEEKVYSINLEEINSPTHVSLFHETLHIYHGYNKSFLDHKQHNIDPIIWSTDEEYRTIMGFPDEQEKDATPITENEYRKAAGLPERFGHVSEALSLLATARFKLLSTMHKQNLESLNRKDSLPPVAICTKDNFTASNVIIMADVKILDNERTLQFYRLHPPDLIEENYLVAPSVMLQAEETRDIVIDFCDELKNTNFELLSLKFVKISEGELSFISSCILDQKKEKTIIDRIFDCSIQ